MPPIPRAEGESSLLSVLSDAVGAEVLAQAAGSLDRLCQQSARRPAEEAHVLLPFGGGKDSAWTLAYVRLMQLLLAERAGRTFTLHVLLMVHPGVPAGVFENVRNVFAALGVDRADSVRVFTATLGGEPVELAFGSIGQDLIAIFRQEVLLSGHLSQGNGRETFCNACNFALMNAIARYVVAAEGGIDFVVTGDSKSEVSSYWKWVQRVAKPFQLARIGRGEVGWGGLFGKLSEINDAYYASLLGERGAEGTPYYFPNAMRQSFAPPDYFGVFDETRYEFWTHEGFLNDFLGFRLREDAFNFTESDCRNPMLMAHLRGLLADFEGRGYLQGIAEYLALAKTLMERKAYDQRMIDLAFAPYLTPEKIEVRRLEAEQHAYDQFGISPLQLEAMVASPLTDERARLDAFLRWRLPREVERAELLRGYFALLGELPRPGAAGEDLPEAALRSQLREAFLLRYPGNEAGLAGAERFQSEALGLSTRSVRLLVDRTAVSQEGARQCGLSELEILRAGDPHQMHVEGPAGQANAILTGR
jgi:hypothetical protein